MRKLFAGDNSNKLSVAQHAATIGHSSKTRVAITSGKPFSATSPASKQNKKTVSICTLSLNHPLYSATAEFIIFGYFTGRFAVS